MKHIVIVPKSVLPNWANEFKMWCPSLRVYVAYAENREERIQCLKQVAQDAEFDVCITTYDAAKIEWRKFARIKWT